MQRQVLGQVEVEDEAAPLPVLGNVAHACIECLARGGVGQVLAAHGHLAAGGLAQAGEQVLDPVVRREPGRHSGVAGNLLARAMPGRKSL